ncbi:enoyl-CoA hydratase/isomerase family protein [Granulosicoccaceae sp. 1_MG-2023]|nr:enoyl-CoA hydratase/isomerase family protein [Granulosicoccaceae sp. 1_MG-2023]
MNYFSLNTDERGVSTLTLNRAEKHNAFDDALISDLTQALKTLAGDGKSRVLVLSARGRSFCAGADLAWMKRMAQFSEAQNLADAEALAGLLHTLNTLPVPTIARVHGPAFGGGVGLIACCDMALACRRARFCLSEVKLGLTPATISPYVVQAIGARASRRYFLTAESFDAERARELGLISEVFNDLSSLDATLEELCTSLLGNGPQAMHEAKRLIRDVAERPNDATLRADTSARIAAQRVSAEGQEGLNAFFAKRRPHWQHTEPENA